MHVSVPVSATAVLLLLAVASCDESSELRRVNPELARESTSTPSACQEVSGCAHRGSEELLSGRWRESCVPAAQRPAAGQETLATRSGQCRFQILEPVEGELEHVAAAGEGGVLALDHQEPLAVGGDVPVGLHAGSRVEHLLGAADLERASHHADRDPPGGLVALEVEDGGAVLRPAGELAA